ncbi:YggT family protein [Cyanothece sp. BG0011]|uniref:YggT family protein n=1 Tax=Cyanothece sp. BG0011 TaxID=2082950 RepID=UPI000D1FA46B|nr:YggT family protein [Cyanothece sp. BG0011]
MNEHSEHNTTHAEDNYQQRQQQMQLQEEELRLEQEEHRLEQARRNLIVNRLLKGMFFLVSALETLLVLRFLLKFAGANPDSLFSQVIYGWSSPFVAPFMNLFNDINLGNSIIEINTITAMIIYGLLATLAARLVEVVAGR